MTTRDTSEMRYHSSKLGGWRIKCVRCNAEGPPAWPEPVGENTQHTTELRHRLAKSLWNRRAVFHETEVKP